jgi:hypothetical protein
VSVFPQAPDPLSECRVNAGEATAQRLLQAGSERSTASWITGSKEGWLVAETRRLDARAWLIWGILFTPAARPCPPGVLSAGR